MAKIMLNKISVIQNNRIIYKCYCVIYLYKIMISICFGHKYTTVIQLILKSVLLKKIFKKSVII